MKVTRLFFRSLKALLAIFTLLSSIHVARSQNIIGAETGDPTAILDLQSTDRGLLIPRMTISERSAITNPAPGLMIFNTTLNCLEINLGSSSQPNWVCMLLSSTASSLDCSSAVITGSLLGGVAASGVSASVPYTGGDGGFYYGQTVASTGVTGLTATLVPGSLAVGSGSLTYTITGTPSGAGTASFALGTGGQNCVLTVTVSPPVGTITGLDCAGASISGTLAANISAVGVSASVPYTGGNAGTYTGQTVTSTGITGLTATLSGGIFANGAGSLTYDISGTPSGAGTASFALNIGGQTCTLTSTVANSPTSGGSAVVSAYTCSTASAGTLVHGVPVSGVTQTITATVSTVGTYSIAVTANGVTFSGSGTFAGTGSRNIVLTASGTPAAAGSNSFTLSTTPSCSFSRTTNPGSVTALNCAGATNAGSLTASVAASGVSSSVPYTGGNGGIHSGQTVSSTGVTGLTATLSSGSFANGAGSLTYNISGTPSASGTASFALNIGGQTCTLTRTVVNNPTSGGSAVVSAYTCSTASTGTLVRGAAASGVTQTITATVGTVGTYSITATANGVTFSGSGTFAGTGIRDIVLTASGTPTASGSNSFALSTTPGCSFSRTTNPGSITSLNCAGASQTGLLSANVAASGVSISVPYSGGNGGTYTGQTVTSTGVTGLTATLSGGTFLNGAGSLIYNITGTPSGAGTASFALSVGGQSCTLNMVVITPGSGRLTGRSCFDIALSNNNTNGCSALSNRTSEQANFTIAATRTQTYTFTPIGTVSNVRFSYVNTNGSVVTSLSGGNSGNNISTAVTATVNYNINLNTLALGRTNSNALTVEISVTYNDGPTNNGTDRQLKLTAQVKDCICCGAFVAAGDWRRYLCHNLGAVESVDPLTPSWQLLGNYYQWGRNPTCFGRDGIDGTNNCSSPVYGAAAPSGSTTVNDNEGSITGWGTVSAPDGAWTDASKTSNDPCPAGYRVPTASQLTALSDNTLNPRTSVGTWTLSSTNYSNGWRFGQTLFLPATGNRNLSSGALSQRGSIGDYWSSTVSGSNARHLGFNSSSISSSTGGSSRTSGFVLRCIAE